MSLERDLLAPPPPELDLIVDAVRDWTVAQIAAALTSRGLSPIERRGLTQARDARLHRRPVSV